MGWIKLDRKIMEHWIWASKPFSEGQAWVDLILLANHKDEKFRHRGKIVAGKRGTVYRSMLFLAERWGWSRKKVKNFLSRLEEEEMIHVEATTQDTSITLIQYAFFQDSRATRRATQEQRENNARTTQEHIQEYIRSIKEEKEGGCAAICPSGSIGELPENYQTEDPNAPNFVDPDYAYYVLRGRG